MAFHYYQEGAANPLISDKPEYYMMMVCSMIFLMIWGVNLELMQAIVQFLQEKLTSKKYLLSMITLSHLKGEEDIPPVLFQISLANRKTVYQYIKLVKLLHNMDYNILQRG